MVIPIPLGGNTDTGDGISETLRRAGRRVDAHPEVLLPTHVPRAYPPSDLFGPGGTRWVSRARSETDVPPLSCLTTGSGTFRQILGSNACLQGAVGWTPTSVPRFVRRCAQPVRTPHRRKPQHAVPPPGGSHPGWGPTALHLLPRVQEPSGGRCSPEWSAARTMANPHFRGSVLALCGWARLRVSCAHPSPDGSGWGGGVY